MASSIDVDAHLAAMNHPQATAIAALRDLIRAAVPEVREHIKWNAPSYFLPGGEDRLTFRLAPPPILQLILHRGAKVKSAEGFAFEAPSDLISWVAPDRGVIAFGGLPDIAARPDLAEVLARWLRLTA